ncbi:GntR family transcriptional regulator [Vagococcus intermedius]|uniref:GntR family transcriptional regulator n=1 Tax=Vagococcus intermedius TaxID=2991418 RepID=A0AAF0CTU6_9ENTE|nr:GntR family transcriptional regulator [Vagococcus intermedius]WEG72860.1 GntR family transcriptional regulator [Vagococcus intermedius]WEG74946.1 GntR family transcriptional regulator [Vagococcus intermedius]
MRRKKVLYLEIADTIKNDIQNNVYPVGSMLPTETEFEGLFEVSKITIRKAVEVLALQGYVEKKSGKGTTVISNRLFNKLSKGDSFSTILEKKGMTLSKKIVNIEKVTLEHEHPYFAFFGAEVTKITRMYELNEEPYIIFNHFIPGKVFQETQEKLADSSLYRILADNHLVVDHFKDQFSVSIIGAAEQNLLATDVTHVMKRVRKSFDNDGKVIEVSVALYNTEQYPYEMEFEI